MQKKAINELEEIKQYYPSLRLKDSDNDWATYSGTIAFTANYESRGLIDDEFEIEIVFPLTGKDYLPTAKETGGRIPHEPDFHINSDGTMCLGVIFEIRRKHKQAPSLKAFINSLLIPFLYAFSFKEKHGHRPFGELSHGEKGVAEYYTEFFGTSSDLVVLELLKIIVEDSYRGHLPCPCNSGKRLRNCHGKQIREMKEQQNREQFFSDFVYCLQAYIDSNKQVPQGLITKRLRSYWNKISQVSDK